MVPSVLSGQLGFQRARAELLETWQARALAAATGKTGAVLLSVLAHNYDDQMLTLLRVVFPGFTTIQAPFLSSAARIAKTGAIVADIVERTGAIAKRAVIYRNATEMQDDFRRLGDALKLNDADREEMFKALKNWVVADRRLDPTMDPQDPDARRLVH